MSNSKISNSVATDLTPFAAAVDTARRERGLSIATLAGAAGVGNGSVQRVLAGQTDYAAGTAVRIGRAVGLSPSAIGRLLAETFSENNS